MFLKLFLLSCFICGAFGTRCYKCKGCLKTTNYQTINCPSYAPSCFVGSDSNNVVLRRCMKINYGARNYCGKISIGSVKYQGCFCTEDGCNGAEPNKISCHQCSNCDRTDSSTLKMCPVGSKGCFSMFFEGKLKERGCSVETEGSRAINEKYFFNFCANDGCNKNLNTFIGPPTTNLTLKGSTVCYVCDNCQIPKETFYCPLAEFCNQYTNNKNQVFRNCGNLNPYICYPRTINGQKETFCSCKGDKCNDAMSIGGVISCPTCVMCSPPVEKYAKECYPGIRGCYIFQKRNTIYHMGCSFHTKNITNLHYKFCEGNMCTSTLTTTAPPTTAAPTTATPTTAAPTTAAPTTAAPTTATPTTAAPTSATPTTAAPTTAAPTTAAHTMTLTTTANPTAPPTTAAPTTLPIIDTTQKQTTSKKPISLPLIKQKNPFFFGFFSFLFPMNQVEEMKQNEAGGFINVHHPQTNCD